MQYIRTVVTNFSKFDKDLVWENAQDLEHVSTVHTHTNNSFHLLYSESFTGKSEYDVLIYRAKRKLLFLSVPTFGFRKVVDKYHLQQVEYIPFFNVTVSLNSLLLDSDKEGFKTTMRDELVVQVPKWLAVFKKLILHLLHRHATIHCQEDEPTRLRMEELAKRGIHMPYRIFHVSAFDELTRRFGIPITQKE